MSMNFRHETGRSARDGQFDVDYDATNGVYRVPIPDDVPLSVLAITAVAEIADVDPLAMEPAYDGHNFDALDAVSDWLDTDLVEFTAVTVTIADHRVTIHPDRELHISPPA